MASALDEHPITFGDVDARAGTLAELQPLAFGDTDTSIPLGERGTMAMPRSASARQAAGQSEFSSSCETPVALGPVTVGQRMRERTNGV